MADEFTYLAYGSNLSTERLRARAPSARVIGKGQLFQHVLRWHKRSEDGSGKCDAFFTGVATDFLWGALYSLSVEDKQRLDRAEGLGNGYEEKHITVSTADGMVDGVTYVASNIDGSRVPYDWYKAYVVAGAREHGFPSPYIAAIEAAPSESDPDAIRAARNRMTRRKLEPDHRGES